MKYINVRIENPAIASAAIGEQMVGQQLRLPVRSEIRRTVVGASSIRTRYRGRAVESTALHSGGCPPFADLDGKPTPVNVGDNREQGTADAGRESLRHKSPAPVDRLGA